jgi:hypothetical protein
MVCAMKWWLGAFICACNSGQTLDASPPVVATTSATSPQVQTDASWSPPSSKLHVDSPYPGGVSVVNDGDAPASVQWEMPIERDDAGKWTRTHVLALMTKCIEEAPLGKCVTIPAHGKIDALPWTGWFGCTQCGICRANAPAQAGRYRVVAIECGSAARIEGPPMTLVEDGRFEKTPHVYAPKTDPTAIVIDNEADEPASFRATTDVAKLDPHNAFETVDHVQLADAGACVTIPAHGTLHSPPFRTKKPGTYAQTLQLCQGQKPLYNDVYGSVWHTQSFVIDATGAAKPE